MSKPELNKEFIIELQGQKFVKYEGLLDLAHQIGIESMVTDIIQFPDNDNGYMAICETVVQTKGGELYSDIGDASPSSVNSMLTPHILRMASTRSKARVLRDLTNIGMTSLDEINTDDLGKKNKVANGADTNQNALIKEAQEIQVKIIQKGKGADLAKLTGGKKLASLEGLQLQDAIEKAKKLI